MVTIKIEQLFNNYYFITSIIVSLSAVLNIYIFNELGLIEVFWKIQ